MLTRNHHRNDLQVHSRALLAHPRDGLFAVLVEIPEQRANYRLAYAVTRAAQSSGWVGTRVGIDLASSNSAPSGVLLNDQYGSTFLLRLPYGFGNNLAAGLNETAKTARTLARAG